MKYSILPLLICFISFSSSAQIKQCGTDEMHQRLYMGFPGIHNKVIQNNIELEQFTANYSLNPEAKASVLYTIPVVFHIIHNYGIENISDAQILDQINVLNEDFQKLNADTSSIAPAFQSIAADCQIEFKLAKIDPLGNCTNGITRNASPETYIGDHAVKSIVHWDPSKYLNVYICADAAGLAGHALVPSAADTLPGWDGIVLAHDYCGSIGTSSPFTSTVLTHEIGHYLNLQHAWGGNNVPGFPYLPVADAGNCAFDDGVLDTPETIGWQVCNLSGTSCSSLDNVQNYMEYAYCAIMFTEGQKVRMHASLNSSIANRDNLWSTPNLLATGVNDSSVFCKTDFTYSDNVVCAGDTIWFADASYNFVTSRMWTFSGATITTQSDSLTFAVYGTEGIYDVKLVSTDGTNSDSLIELQLITVLPSAGSNWFISEGFESALSLPNLDWYINNPDGSVGWEVNNSVGYEGSSSAYINNLGAGTGQTDDLVSYPIDASGLTDIELEFKYAYSKASSLSADNLKVYVSNNCGDSWVIRKSISTFDLATVPDTLISSFSPANQTEWKSVSITNIAAAFFVDNLMVKFAFTSGNGNNIYIDNINLFDPNTIGTREFSKSDFKIYPNPSNGNATILLPTGFKVSKHEILNVNGQLIYSASYGSTDDEIVIKDLNPGWYTVRISNEDQFFSLPIIVY
jgi:hypothetical protein